MENCSFYNALVNDVDSLTTDQLISLKSVINSMIETRENEKMIDLKEKAINAIKDYFNAGGAFQYDGDIICMVGENSKYDYFYIYLG